MKINALFSTFSTIFQRFADHLSIMQLALMIKHGNMFAIDIHIEF